MHPIQQAILDLAQTRDLGHMKLREIGSAIGNIRPQTVKYHLDVLIRRGLLEKTRGQTIRRVDPNRELAGLIQIPILGAANAGEALTFADDNITGFLPVSPSILNTHNYNGLFCVIASGRSMNAANIDGKNIQDGDFVIAKRKNLFSYETGDYIVASFEGRANIKKLIKYTEDNYIVLQSESLEPMPPIYISENDLDRFQVHGEIVQVLHSPKNTSRELFFST